MFFSKNLALSMLAALMVMGTPAAAAEPTDWFHQARWGVMTHYLGAPPSSKGGAELTAEMWNQRVDAFDVDGLVNQLASTGTKYLLFTIGQNSGHYCSPNAAYDRIVGITPSKCSRRDLIADLAKALAARNIRLMVYLPSGAPGTDPVARKALGWRWGCAGRLATARRARGRSAGRVPAEVGGGHPRVVVPLGQERGGLVDRRLLLRRPDVPLRRRAELRQLRQSAESGQPGGHRGLQSGRVCTDHLPHQAR